MNQYLTQALVNQGTYTIGLAVDDFVWVLPALREIRVVYDGVASYLEFRMFGDDPYIDIEVFKSASSGWELIYPIRVPDDPGLGFSSKMWSVNNRVQFAE